jgi:hypothetical protein
VVVARHDLRQVPVHAQRESYAGDRSAVALVLAKIRSRDCGRAHRNRDLPRSDYAIRDERLRTTDGSFSVEYG